MNRLRKTIAVLLVLCLTLSLGITAFAEGESVDTFNYVVLGASMTNGYGMRYYLEPYYYDYPSQLSMDGPGASGINTLVTGSYPALITNTLRARGYNVKTSQLAQSSMRVEELRFLIDDTFTADKFTKWRFYNEANDSGWWGSGNLDSIRALYKESIADADLITYDLGVNNFGVYLSNQLMSDLFDYDFAHIVGEEYAAKFYELRDQVHAKILALAGDADSEIFAKIESYTDPLAYALLGCIVNFDATMKIIRELNPDCDIVVVSIQNPMAGLDLSYNGIVIPFGELYGLMVDNANTYFSLLSPYAGEYSFADVRQDGRVSFFFDDMMEYDGNPYSLSQNVLDCFNVYDRKIHANERVKTALKSVGVIPSDVAVNNNLIYDAENKEIYENVLYGVYDVLARIFKAAGDVNPMPLDGIIAGDGDLGKAGDELMDGIKAIVEEAATAYLTYELSGEKAPEDDLFGGYSADIYDIDTAIDNLLTTDARKVAAAFGMRTSIGNTFFTHPSEKGHKELANGILRAWDLDVSGTQAAIEAVAALEDKAFDLSIKYGSNFAVLLAEKYLEILPLDEETTEALTSLLPSAPTVSEVVKAILANYGIDSFKGNNSLLSIMNDLDRYCQANPFVLHDHTPELVRSKKATLTTDGNRAYYYCSDCNKMFSDYNCTHEITKDDVVIPAIGRKLAGGSAVPGAAARPGAAGASGGNSVLAAILRNLVSIGGSSTGSSAGFRIFKPFSIAPRFSLLSIILDR